MLKKLSMLAAVVVTVLAVRGGVVSAHPATTDDDKVSICHSTQPQPSNGNGQGSQNNPYTHLNVNKSSINNLPNGHDTHEGPVFNNSGQDFWGDIIPEFDNYPGLNWDAEGQAIYRNHCGFVTEGAFVTFSVDCVSEEAGVKAVVTLTNSGQSAGSATVNGQEVEVAAGETVTLSFDLGQAIEIVINEDTVYDQTPVCVGGRGADEPVTPAAATPQVVAPKAGVAAGGSGIALIALLAASAVSVVFGVTRLRKTSL